MTKQCPLFCVAGFVARMDVTKQEDMSAFYRNLLDQTTDSTVKVEPAQTDDTTSVDERYVYFIHPAVLYNGLYEQLSMSSLTVILCK